MNKDGHCGLNLVSDENTISIIHMTHNSYVQYIDVFNIMHVAPCLLFIAYKLLYIIFVLHTSDINVAMCYIINSKPRTEV